VSSPVVIEPRQRDAVVAPGNFGSGRRAQGGHHGSGHEHRDGEGGKARAASLRTSRRRLGSCRLAAPIKAPGRGAGHCLIRRTTAKLSHAMEEPDATLRSRGGSSDLRAVDRARAATTQECPSSSRAGTWSAVPLASARTGKAAPCHPRVAGLVRAPGRCPFDYESGRLRRAEPRLRSRSAGCVCYSSSSETIEAARSTAAGWSDTMASL
jgi:hypothetical protein